MERIALVAGGSGLVGGLLIEELLAARTRVYAVGRRALKPRPNLFDHLVDFAALKDQALPRADVAFCCLGTTLKKAGSREAFRAVDLDAVLAFARAAKAGGTPRLFVVTAHGANPRSRVFYNRVKGEAEQALREVGFEALGLARPSLLLGDRAEVRRGERVAIVVGRALGALLQHFDASPIEARTVARALVALGESHRAGVRVFDNQTLKREGAGSAVG